MAGLIILGLLTLSACSGSDSASGRPSVVVSTGSAAPSVPAASGSAGVPTVSVTPVEGPERVTFTDESLADVLTSVRVDGRPLKALPPEYLANVVANTQATIDILEENDLDPQGCRSALIGSLEVVNVDVPVALGGTDVQVQLYAFPGEAEARAAVEAQRAVLDACPSYTLTSDEGGESVSSTTEVADGGIVAPSVPNAVSAASSYDFDGEEATTLTTSASVGPVFIQITDSFAEDASSRATSIATLEAVGAAVSDALEG